MASGSGGMTGFVPSLSMCVAPQIRREGEHKSLDQQLLSIDGNRDKVVRHKVHVHWKVGVSLVLQWLHV